MILNVFFYSCMRLCKTLSACFVLREGVKEKTGVLAWWPWGLLLGVVAAFILGGSVRSVTPLYFEAAEHWLQGDDLYIRGGRGFLYLPQAAILAIPFHMLPRVPAELLWRLMTIGVFAAGVHRLCRLASGRSGDDFFVVVSVVAVPLAWSSALNGQSTLTISGLLMLAAGDIACYRYWRAAVLLALALALKPLAIVMILLVAPLFRPMRVRLVATCGVAVVLPFLVQAPEYVADQYAECLTMFVDAARLGVQTLWAQLFGLAKVLKIDVSEPVQAVVRVAAAGLTLAAGWHACRRVDRARGLVYLYTLGACYLMLFNPRTENNSYAMLGPSIGWCCAEALLVERRRARGLFYVILALGTVGSHDFGKFLLPAQRAIWLAPLMAVCFSIVVTVRLWHEAAQGKLHQDAASAAEDVFAAKAEQIEIGRCAVAPSVAVAQRQECPASRMPCRL